eukprot:scaffold31258_cov58-Phaeocystis_antarctica.AAC.4
MARGLGSLGPRGRGSTRRELTAACPAMLRRETICSPLPVGSCATHAMLLRGVARAEGRTKACTGVSSTSTQRSRDICIGASVKRTRGSSDLRTPNSKLGTLGVI